MSEHGMKTLAVLGATGAQGGAILRHFAKHRLNFRLRGITRDPNSEKAKELAVLGVDIVRADYKDEDSLYCAFDGATHIYANIDSISLIMEAMQQPDLLTAGQSPFERAAELEKALAENVIKAAAASDALQRLIWSTLPGPARRSNGKYTKATHFDAKAAVEEMFQANAVLQPKLSLLVFGLYTDMPARAPPLYPISKVAEDTYKLELPLGGTGVLPFANVEFDAGGWVAALLDAPPNTKLIGCSEKVSWNEWIEAWATCNSVKAQYHQCDEESLASAMGGAGGLLLDAMKFVAEYGMAGGDPTAVMPGDLEAPCTSVAEALRLVDWAGVL